MKKAFAIMAALTLVASAGAYSAQGVVAGNGNGAPQGAHYNLNIIGVSKDKTASMDDNNGHRIFVSLKGKTKINLVEGTDFAVLDANGTDGNGATFQLPNPDADNDGVTTYSVFARALGTPGGSARIATCGTDAGPDGVFGTADDEEVCSMETLEVGRTVGKGHNNKFQDVSRELLYIYVEDMDFNGDGIIDLAAGRYPLFSEELQGYFWDYDNNGLKLLQLRFYPQPSDVN